MSRLPSAALIAARRGLAAPQPRIVAPYMLTWDFGDITTGNSVEASAKVDSEFDFATQQMNGLFYFAVITAAAIAYTPLCEESHQTVGSNTMQNLATVRLMITLRDTQIFRTAIRAPLLLGKGKLPSFMQTAMRFKAGATVTIRAYNDGLNTIQGQIIAIGAQAK